MRGIHNVLAPGGEARIMVYNLGGMPAYVTMATRYLLGFWFGRSSRSPPVAIDGRIFCALL